MKINLSIITLFSFLILLCFSCIDEKNNETQIKLICEQINRFNQLDVFSKLELILDKEIILWVLGGDNISFVVKMKNETAFIENKFGYAH